MKKIGLMTGGGDCPGLNAAIRAILQEAHFHHITVEGIIDGWKGFIEKNFIKLTPDSHHDLLTQGGTILGSSRVNPLKNPKQLQKIIQLLKKKSYHALIFLAGEGTLEISQHLHQAGIPIICIPKTIDNDTYGSDFSIGFQTALQTATEAIDRLHNTAKSHHRIMLVEVMGRYSGWIAASAGIAGGAHLTLIPEKPRTLLEIVEHLRFRNKTKNGYTLIVLSEDAKIILKNKKILRPHLKKDAFQNERLAGLSAQLASLLEKELHQEVRYTILGHVQRGGTPNAFDRVLATRMGVRAVSLALENKFGRMLCLSGNQIKDLSISEAAGKLNPLPSDLIEICQKFI
ncbi:MAG: ATP-dependent 6-phosphofructokinase [Deltaproteobacteria bacterium]|nr:ATP-dependent 6-phosphofructokinase [Deltaproteobacteria bacterium]